ILFIYKKFNYFFVLFFFLFLSVASALFSGAVTIYATTMLIIATMISFCLIIPLFSYNMVKVNRVLLWTGVIVGTISVLELTVFYNYMVSYWAATDGIRSISSLLNPTNSGAYSAIIILIALVTNIKSLFKRALFLIMPMITLISSGSRTAWLSLGMTLLLTVVLRDSASIRLRKKIFTLASIGTVCGALYAIFYMG
ncbi:O145 family O-antigen polymerase, partial [Escherichia coli]|nr:O145 family O-antigen polymerase [Escherichia coli]